MTAPTGTVVLASGVTVPTVNPAAVNAVVAAACRRLVTFGTATSAGPLETTSATLLPMTTSVPPTGLWLMTNPAGTVSLDAVETLPMTRPTAVIALPAAACVRFTTAGTDTSGRPDETTSVTAVPETTDVPASGLWLMTLPAGTVRLAAVLIAPAASPDVVIMLIAAACARPTTSGTATYGRPEDTTMATALPITTSAPADGF